MAFQLKILLSTASCWSVGSPGSGLLFLTGAGQIHKPLQNARPDQQLVRRNSDSLAILAPVWIYIQVRTADCSVRLRNSAIENQGTTTKTNGYWLGPRDVEH